MRSVTGDWRPSFTRGFFAVGVFHPKKEVNVGSLFRTANILGAAFTFTIGKRYAPQHSDTQRHWRHIPLMHFDGIDSLRESAPRESLLIGVEMCERAMPIERFSHPERAIYLLGAEDHGLPQSVLDRCHGCVKLAGDVSMNVAVAGSIVIYHRAMTSNSNKAEPK